MQVDLMVLVGFLVALGTLIGLCVKGYLKIKGWIAGIAQSSQQSAKQLATSNGTTVAGYIEGSSRKLDRLVEDMAEQKKLASENRDLAQSALTLANSAHARLDQHLINDHGVHMTPNQSEE